MIALLPGRRVFAYAGPVDMRKGYDSLAALVEQDLQRDVLSGELFLFVARNRVRAKVLVFDGSGLCLLAKRLEKGRFACLWRGRRGGVLRLSRAELALFLEGSQVVGRKRLVPDLLTQKELAIRTSL
jgi:transposase